MSSFRRHRDGRRASPDLRCGPSTSERWPRPSRGWWHDLIAAGSGGSAFVMALQGDPKTWDSWQTIRKAKPAVEYLGRATGEAPRGAGQSAGGFTAQGPFPFVPPQRPDGRR